jgi:cation:H+ antiporter
MKACDPFEEASQYLGRNMAPGTKGATIDAVASSAPEFIVAALCLWVFQDRAGFSSGIATTAGSAVFNAMIIPGMCILTVLIFLQKDDFAIDRGVILRDGFFLLTAEVVLIYALSTGHIAWYHSMSLLIVYMAYMLTLYVQHRRHVCH